MSNLTRFYWLKFQGAVNLFQKHQTEDDLDKVQDICCQLTSESRCPPLCQIEAWKLRSQCYPRNYWFAKAQLERALDYIVWYEDEDECIRDPTALVVPKRSVEAMLKNLASKYQQEWRARGRDVPPTEDEWYKIVESASRQPEPIFEFIGEPFNGSDWPFETQAVEASVLNGKTFPPHHLKAVPAEPVQQQEHKNEQDTDVVMGGAVEASEQTAEEVWRLWHEGD